MFNDERLDGLMAVLKGYGSVAVAFSGGADSSLVAYSAYAALGEDAQAVHVSTQTVPKRDSEDAGKLAREIGIRAITVDMDILDDPYFNDNPPDRCGICKARLMGEVIDHARRSNITEVADGAVMDDLSDYRPGHLVADKLGIKHPLIETGLLKKDVMELLDGLGLSSAGKAPSPCLASRIPYGQAITSLKLKRIDRMENIVRECGFRIVRVRLHETTSGDLIGVLEVDDVKRALDMWDELKEMDPEVRMVLDPGGYRMGSLNELLTSP